MARQATKACGNRYFEARMRAAKWNEKLSTRAGAIDYLPGVTEDSLKKYELDITTATIDPEAVMTYKAVEQLIAASTLTKEITIPATGWENNQEALEPDGESREEPPEGDITPNEEPPGLHIDIPVLEATEETVPQLAIWPIHADTARSCGLYTSCKSMAGAVRLYAKKAPASEIKASLTLLNVRPSAESGVNVHITPNSAEEE